AIERVEYVTRRTVEVLMAELPYVTLLLRVRGNTTTERWAMERRREFDQRVSDLLKAAAADGDLRADMDIRLATRLLFGMVNSLVEWYRPHPGSGYDGDQVAEAVVRLAFDGLRTDS
ncbi:TetR/AcrR family transcriptional regulator C-terminal domain-containing protein, partial [Streptomyces lunaelactis]